MNNILLLVQNCCGCKLYMELISSLIVLTFPPLIYSYDARGDSLTDDNHSMTS